MNQTGPNENFPFPPARASILLPLFSAQENLLKRWTNAPRRTASCEQAIQAFLDEAEPDFELIIIDDGTRSRVLEHLKEIFPELDTPTSRLRIAHVKKSLRWSKLIEEASHQAQGAFIGWMDPLMVPAQGWLKSLRPLLDHHDLILMVKDEVLKRQDSVRAMLESPHLLPRFGLLKRGLFDRAQAGLVRNLPLGRLQERTILLRALLDLLKSQQGDRLALMGSGRWQLQKDPPSKQLLSAQSIGWLALSFSAGRFSKEHWYTLANQALKKMKEKKGKSK